MSCSISIESGTETDIKKNGSISIRQSVLPVFPIIPSKVTSHPKVYSIVGNDVFIIKRNDDPDQFFIDLIDSIIDDSGLSDEVADLDDRFENFENGVTLEIGHLQTADEELAFSVETLKVSDDTHTAGIQNLNVVKITATDATAISNTVIGAWQNGAGGAWFEERVAVVSNVAFSAAKSASTLTASIDSQQSQITAIIGDISTLESQVDGKIETFFSEENPVLPNGDIDPNVEPYKTWVAEGTQAQHTGDTYIFFEFDPVIIDKKNILVTFRFAFDTDLEVYIWYVFEDDLASLAFQNALDAQATADGKTVVYYQASFPYPSAGTTSDPIVIDTEDKKVGDVLVESDNENKMWRYNRSPITGGTTVTFLWQEIDDQRISASVNRLDEATVDVFGNARAKSSLVVDANGSISGFVAESDGSTSDFKIFADKFTVANSLGSDRGNPFTIDTQTNQIVFTGNVSFVGTPVDTALQNGDAATDVNNNVTTINGGKITTASLTADKISANTIWVDGQVRSNDYKFGDGSDDPITGVRGFKLQSNRDSNNALYHIIGGRIFGGFIEGTLIKSTTLESSTIKVRDLIVLTDADLETSSVISSLSNNGIFSIYPFNHPTNSNRVASQSGNNIVFSGQDSSGFVIIGTANTTQSFGNVKVYGGSTLLGNADITTGSTANLIGIQFRYRLNAFTNEAEFSILPVNTFSNFLGNGQFRYELTTGNTISYNQISGIVYNI